MRMTSRSRMTSGWLGLDRVGSARLHFWLQLPDFRLVVVDRDLFNLLICKCPGRGSNPHGGHPPQDFKSCASASSATRAHAADPLGVPAVASIKKPFASAQVPPRTRPPRLSPSPKASLTRWVFREVSCGAHETGALEPSGGAEEPTSGQEGRLTLSVDPARPFCQPPGTNPFPA